HRLGDQRSTANALNGMGAAYAAAAQYEDARHKFGEALSVARTIGAGHEEAVALRGIGTVEAGVGELAPAEEHLRAALTLAELIPPPAEVLRAAHALAGVLEQLGRPVEANSIRARLVSSS